MAELTHIKEKNWGHRNRKKLGSNLQNTLYKKGNWGQTYKIHFTKIRKDGLVKKRKEINRVLIIRNE